MDGKHLTLTINADNPYMLSVLDKLRSEMLHDGKHEEAHKIQLLKHEVYNFRYDKYLHGRSDDVMNGLEFTEIENNLSDEVIVIQKDGSQTRVKRKS